MLAFSPLTNGSCRYFDLGMYDESLMDFEKSMEQDEIDVDAAGGARYGTILPTPLRIDLCCPSKFEYSLRACRF